MRHKTWQFHPDQSELASKLSYELNVSEIVSRLLINRGISTSQAANSFLKPDLSDLFDPYLMLDMEKAADRILQAINNREKILIYGDFDADGITSTALLLHFFKLLVEVLQVVL